MAVHIGGPGCYGFIVGKWLYTERKKNVCSCNALHFSFKLCLCRNGFAQECFNSYAMFFMSSFAKTHFWYFVTMVGQHSSSCSHSGGLRISDASTPEVLVKIFVLIFSVNSLVSYLIDCSSASFPHNGVLNVCFSRLMIVTTQRSLNLPGFKQYSVWQVPLERGFLQTLKVSHMN